MASELRAVLDTNVVVAAVLNPDGLPAAIVSAAIALIFRLCLSDPILEEYGEVLTRGKFQFPQEIVASLLTDLEATSLKVKPTVPLSLTKDPADNKFLECAIAANASFLVTGNSRHFPLRCRNVQVITSRVFFALLVEQLFS